MTRFRPVEMLQVHITPSDFFTGNPAIDVPSSLDSGSKLANGECCKPAAVNGNGV